PPYNMQLDPGLTQTGTVVGPDGLPLAGARVSGLTPVGSAKTLSTAEFTASGLEPDHPRQLLFVHKERGLGVQVTLRGDEKVAPTVKLEQLGTVTGRIVDNDGQPYAGLQVRPFYTHKIFYQPVHWW